MGPIIPYQVPETLISTTAHAQASESVTGRPERQQTSSSSTVEESASFVLSPIERESASSFHRGPSLDASIESLADPQPPAAHDNTAGHAPTSGEQRPGRTISRDFAAAPTNRATVSRSPPASRAPSIPDLRHHRRQPSVSPTRTSARDRIIAESRRGSRSSSVRSSSPLGTQLPFPPPAGHSHLQYAHHRDSYSSTVATTSSNHLLDFKQIADYVIPKSQLKHRLITCTCSSDTWLAWSRKDVGGRQQRRGEAPLKEFAVLGFPCTIEDERYDRNEFRWNMGFVFDGNADLSAFEPVVRKCGRILRAAELDSRYLSSPATKDQMQSVLEQIFEDLNSYSETSITVDGINYLELKLFPFFRERSIRSATAPIWLNRCASAANPPPVEDWHVPVPLVDLAKIKDPNWDLTASKVTFRVDLGRRHVCADHLARVRSPVLSTACITSDG